MPNKTADEGFAPPVTAPLALEPETVPSLKPTRPPIVPAPPSIATDEDELVMVAPGSLWPTSPPN